MCNILVSIDLLDNTHLNTFRLTFDEEVDLFVTAYYFHDAIHEGRTIDPLKVKEQKEKSMKVWTKIKQSLESRGKTE